MEYCVLGSYCKGTHKQGKEIDEDLLVYLSPLGWEHINLTGDYIWQQEKQSKQEKFRPLRKNAEP
jgi:hypothetical protein